MNEFPANIVRRIREPRRALSIIAAVAVFLVFGVGELWLAIGAVKSGVYHGRGRHIVERADHPIEFWIWVGLLFAGAAITLGFALLVLWLTLFDSSTRRIDAYISSRKHNRPIRATLDPTDGEETD